MQQVHAQDYNRASLLAIGILIVLTWGAAITLATVALAGLVFLVLDLVHKRNAIPNLVVTDLLVLHLILWQIRYTPLWQKPAEIFAQAFF